MSDFYETLRIQAQAMATQETPVATAPIFSVSRRLTNAGANFALDQAIAMITPREIDANCFALTNRDFAPVTLAD